MSKKNIVERGIRSVRDVIFEKKSPGHNVGLVIEPNNWEDVDPFLIMAEDYFVRGIFGMHPHRGIETVTYIIDGKLEHIDNKGGEGVLKAGDDSW